MANLTNDAFYCQYGDDNEQVVFDEDVFEDFSEDNSLNIRFITKKDGLEELWLVFDILNGNAVVGIHESETLAFLDASKREQDTYLSNAALH